MHKQLSNSYIRESAQVQPPATYCLCVSVVAAASKFLFKVLVCDECRQALLRSEICQTAAQQRSARPEPTLNYTRRQRGCRTDHDAVTVFAQLVLDGAASSDLRELCSTMLRPDVADPDIPDSRLWKPRVSMWDTASKLAPTPSTLPISSSPSESAMPLGPHFHMLNAWCRNSVPYTAAVRHSRSSRFLRTIGIAQPGCQRNRHIFSARLKGAK